MILILLSFCPIYQNTVEEMRQNSIFFQFVFRVTSCIHPGGRSDGHGGTYGGVLRGGECKAGILKVMFKLDKASKRCSRDDHDKGSELTLRNIAI